MPDEVRPPSILSRTVCIVDDHDIVRSSLVHAIEEAGHRVLAADGTYAAGLRSMVLHRPDVGVIDNRLPDGRGIDLCRELTGLVPSIRLILHTGVIEYTTEMEALAAGATAVIAKSIRNVELLAAVAGV